MSTAACLYPECGYTTGDSAMFQPSSTYMPWSSSPLQPFIIGDRTSLIADITVSQQIHICTVGLPVISVSFSALLFRNVSYGDHFWQVQRFVSGSFSAGRISHRYRKSLSRTFACGQCSRKQGSVEGSSDPHPGQCEELWLLYMIREVWKPKNMG